MAWSPDSNQIASAGDDGTAQVWDASTGKRSLTYHGYEIAAWSPAGKLIVSDGDEGVQVWNSVS